MEKLRSARTSNPPSLALQEFILNNLFALNPNGKPWQVTHLTDSSKARLYLRWSKPGPKGQVTEKVIPIENGSEGYKVGKSFFQESPTKSSKKG